MYPNVFLSNYNYWYDIYGEVKLTLVDMVYIHSHLVSIYSHSLCVTYTKGLPCTWDVSGAIPRRSVVDSSDSLSSGESHAYAINRTCTSRRLHSLTWTELQPAVFDCVSPLSIGHTHMHTHTDWSGLCLNTLLFDQLSGGWTGFRLRYGTP